MGRLIGSGNPGNYGENYFIEKIQEYLDDTNIIYWNRQVFGKEFDVCILMPGKGILVVELKGWREENILRIENNDSVIIRTADGEVSASPQRPEDTVFRLNGTFGKTQGNSLSFSKWCVCRRYPGPFSGPNGLMLLWRKSSLFSKKT